MAKLNVLSVVRKVMSVAKDMGLTGQATFVRTSEADIDEETGARTGGTTLAQIVDAVEQDPTRLSPNAAALFTEAQGVLWVEAAALTWVPAFGDSVVWAGRSTAVGRVVEVATTGTILGYYIGRGGR